MFELTANYSWGVNRAILHGTPYAKAFNGGVFTGGMGGSGNADWPGWDPFGKSSFGEAYTYRQIYWDKEKTVTDYLSRIQALLQYTKQKVDVAVLQDYHEAFENPSGNSFQSLLDNGYSYNLLTNGLLNSEDARKISGGVISPAGPAYKAVILDQVETLTLSSLNLLLAYADGGIPIILFDCDPATARVYGSDAGKDAQLRAKYQTLQAKSNVKTTSDKAEIPLLLKSLGVNPFARYSIPKLETTLYRDEATKTNYYYLFNNTSLFQGMLSAGSAKAYKDETAAAWGVPIDAPVVTLEGEGVPYVLDPFTGDTRQVGQYQANGDGTVSVRLDTIPGGNAAILALSAGDACTKQGKIVSSVTGGNDYRILRDSEGGPILRASSNGTWGVQMADGTSVSVTVRDMPGEMNLGASPWNLTLDSYGPKYADAKDLLGADNLQLVDPSETRITRADLGPVSLVSWGALSADASVVKQLIGVSNRSPADVNSATMNNISGRGYYSTSFQWASADVGAELKLSYANDQITGVVINGATLSVNNLTDRVDIGKYLKTGTNQLTVELSSTLNHRAGFEKDVSNIYSGGFGGATPSRYLENGLLGAVLIPYQDAPLTKEVPDPQNPAPPTPDPGTPHPDLPSVSIETVSIKSIAKQIYTGKQIRPAVSLTKDGKKLAASDYTIAYGANKKIGLGTVTIKGKGTFTGTRTLSFKIVPQKPTKLKVSAPGKNTLKITFNRVSKAQNIKKYRVLYRSKGALSWKYKTVTVKLTGRDGARTTASVTLKNLQKGKVYQIRVYAFAGNCKGYPTGIRTKTVQ